MKLVSVIVPVYNMEKLLTRCIDSILGQTYSNIELILIDDGSKDNSGEICNAYQEKDNRVTALHKSNSGVADASNMGLDHASGDYIAFVDSDDYISKDMIQKLIDVQEQTNADIVQTGMTRVNDKNAVTHIQSFEPAVILSTEEIIREFFNGRSILLCLAAKLFSRHLFDGYRFESGRNIIDILAMPELLRRSDKYAITDGADYMAYFREESVSRGLFTDTTYDDCKHYLSSWADFLEKYYSDKKEYMAMIYYRAAYEMAYKYSLLVKSPYVTNKSQKKREMRKLFLSNYQNLLKSEYFSEVEKKKKFAFRLFSISPALFQMAMKVNTMLNRQ